MAGDTEHDRSLRTGVIFCYVAPGTLNRSA